MLLCLALTILLALPARAADTIRLGYIPVGDCLQLYVAEEMNYFAEEGVSVKTTPLKGGSLIAMAVEAGELDAGWSNTVSLAIAEDKGFDFTILSPGAFEVAPDHRSHSLLVKADSPIKTFADLRGKTIAINTLGNINEVAVTALAEENGLRTADFRLVEVPFPQMIAALDSGSVDAVLTLEPFVTLGLTKKTARLLEPAALKAYGDHFLIASWFTTRTWEKNHPDTARAFRRAMLKASAYIRVNQARARDILTRHTKLSPELAAAITLPAFAGEIAKNDVQPLIDLAARYGFISAPFPAERLLPAGN
jgi:NitT/TauT family transport system substrate-binding protein